MTRAVEQAVPQRIPEQASFRNHSLRIVQRIVGRYTVPILHTVDWLNWLEGTKIHEVFENEQKLHPDDITLSGLQLTVVAAESFVLGATLVNRWQYFLGGSLDALDGAFARKLGVASTVGAIKDVLIDRLCDSELTCLIARERARYPNALANLEQKLRVAFQLSTLTKALCEMTNVQTKEGGQGGMLQRRRRLRRILIKLGKLKNMSEFNESAQRLLESIDYDLELLINASLERAKERIAAINAANVEDKYWWNNPELQNPNSKAAIEMCKYVAVVLMNQKLGIDMVAELNALAGEVEFPTLQRLIGKYPYINDCVGSTTEFLDEAMRIVSPQDEQE